jgi:alpha-ketoglutaric semialdehyde dehydrogenase
MGSVNPVFILPGAMKRRSREIAEGLAASVTLGAGQFCTNPGLVITQSSDISEGFYQDLSDSISRTEAGTMLTRAIHQAYEKGRHHLGSQSGVRKLASGKATGKDLGGIPAIYQVSSKDFISNKSLEEEVFGPASLMVSSDDKKELLHIASRMNGHLTASLFGTEEELPEYRELIGVLEQKVGRLIINGFPTGVEVCHSMNHGGPFPATTDCRTTSVGTASIYRFSRPVCYQNFPDHLLPEELQEANPKHIWRLYNGTWIQ